MRDRKPEGKPEMTRGPWVIRPERMERIERTGPGWPALQSILSSRYIFALRPLPSMFGLGRACLKMASHGQIRQISKPASSGQTSLNMKFERNYAMVEGRTS